MTPDRLLHHFDRISDASDAIPRLRRFVLDLAVRGKLAEQDPTDEPASEWLKRVQAEKPRVENGDKKAPYKPERLLEEVDLPFSIPTSWAWTRLDLLAEKITDGEHLSPNKTASGMPLLTATHVTAQGLTLSNPQFGGRRKGQA